jgi:hypothetical protein
MNLTALSAAIRDAGRDGHLYFAAMRSRDWQAVRSSLIARRVDFVASSASGLGVVNVYAASAFPRGRLAPVESCLRLIRSSERLPRTTLELSDRWDAIARTAIRAAVQRGHFRF